MKKMLLIAITALSIVQYEAFAGIEATFDEFLYETKTRAQYYKPYIISGSLAGLSALSNKAIGHCLLAAAGIYSAYAWCSGFFEIREIRHKYKRNTRVSNHWSGKKEDENPFLLCRWRQRDDQFGDGIYWPTPQQMQNAALVLNTLKKDIFSNRIILIDQGKKIDRPRPEQVLTAINREIKELKHDKETLKKYTDVYRRISNPEDFKAETTYMRLFWPNYNHASHLYVDIVTMLERLEALREIIANMKSSSGGAGWPQVR